MEIVTGLSLAYIFMHNNNWLNFLSENYEKIRPAILINVSKMLACRTKALGFMKFECPHCNHSVTVHFSCKSKFCSSCGKKATDIWILKNLNIMPNTKWQHITFTMPYELWNLFWLNRHLFNILPSKAANIMKDIASKKGIMPGLFVAIHSFGRDIKRNVHIHLSIILGGLIKNNSKWSFKLYFHHRVLKNKWKYAIITMLRKQYKSGNLILPSNLNHIKDYSCFNSWLNFLYNKNWVVFLQKPSKNYKRNIQYLGKYLKRPPIGETRIKSYDGKFVTFQFLDHYDNSKKYLTLPVFDFISRVITHIHDSNFRSIRYFGFLSNRLRGKLLPVVHSLLRSSSKLSKKFYLSWQNLIISSFGFDPLLCPNCHTSLLLSNIVFPSNSNLFLIHGNLARL